jgi:hypothetical protein
MKFDVITVDTLRDNVSRAAPSVETQTAQQRRGDVR